MSKEYMETPKSKVPSLELLQMKMDRWLEQLEPPIVVALHRQGVCPRLTEIAASPGSKLNMIVGPSNIVGNKLGHSPSPKGFISLNGIAWVKAEQTGELLDHCALQAGKLTISKRRHPRGVAILEGLELTRSWLWRREVK